MSAVGILSASHCNGNQVAARIARGLMAELIDTPALIRLAAQRHDFPIQKLERLVQGSSKVFDGISRSQERGMAYIRSALSEALSRENLVLLGPAVLMLPQSLTHVLRVGLAASQQFRLQQADIQHLARDDALLTRWSERFRDLPPFDESLHDILLPMHDMSLGEAVEQITENIGKPALMRTAKVEQALLDFKLAARVNVVLAEAGHHVDVLSHNGRLTLTINKYVMRLHKLERDLTELASSCEGVNGVETRLGHGFIKEQPKIYPRLDVDMPSKVMLVDDEREFVHTLSERLRARHLDAVVAYDGEEALAMLQSEIPSVMVLDLKMPGIDGLEVLRRVKKQHPGVEVIILSGHGSDAEQNLAIELGAFAYLQKPADIDVLAATMKEAHRKVQQKTDQGGPEAPVTG